MSLRDSLLETTEGLVLTRGFSATSTIDIIDAAGVTKGALYHYFPQKTDLEMAVLARAGEEFLAWLDSALACGTSPKEQLESFFEAALSHHNASGFIGGCLFGNTALEMSDVSRQHVEIVNEVFVAWADKIAAVVLRGQRLGQIRSDISAADLSQMIVSSIEGGIMFSRLRKDAQPLRNCITLLRVLLWGMDGALEDDFSDGAAQENNPEVGDS